jgi:RES domain
MTDKPGDLDPPHPELPTQTPLIFDLKMGDVLYRHHQSALDPIYFGTTGKNRFDDPDCPAGHSLGVLYAAEDAHGAFIESCEISARAPAVSGAYLDARAMALMEVTQDLRFVDLFTTGGLTRIGADSRLFAGSHTIAKQWSAALRSHPCKPDGIRYPARHDHTRAAYAIFSRPPSTFKVSSLGSLMAPANRALLNDILTLYNVDLI